MKAGVAAVFFAAALLAACETTRWAHPQNEQGLWDRDWYQCQNYTDPELERDEYMRRLAATSARGFAEIGTGGRKIATDDGFAETMARNRAFNKCMYRRGWRLETEGAHR
jgi:hypothetical protein